jgi:hypothetical protein
LEEEVVSEAASAEWEGSVVILEFDRIHTWLWLPFYNNDNEFSVFKLPKISWSIHRTHLRARIMLRLCIEDKNSIRSASFRCEIQNLLSRMQEKYDDSKYSKFNQ